MTATILHFPAPAAPADNLLLDTSVRCTIGGELLALDDATPDLGCDSGEWFCGDHLHEHIVGCRVCAAAEADARDER